MKTVIAAALAALVFAGTAEASCNPPKYIAKGDPGSKIASLVTLPGVAVLTLIAQPLRLLDGGKAARDTRCLLKHQLRDVTRAY